MQRLNELTKFMLMGPSLWFDTIARMRTTFFADRCLVKSIRTGLSFVRAVGRNPWVEFDKYCVALNESPRYST